MIGARFRNITRNANAEILINQALRSRRFGTSRHPGVVKIRGMPSVMTTTSEASAQRRSKTTMRAASPSGVPMLMQYPSTRSVETHYRQAPN